MKHTLKYNTHSIDGANLDDDNHLSTWQFANVANRYEAGKIARPRDELELSNWQQIKIHGFDWLS